VEPEQSLQPRIRECLTALGISSPVDWDVLVFVYRHQASLANAEQISHMVGYPATLVHDALENLEFLKLLRRSKASNGMSLYRLVSSRAASPPCDCFRELMASVDNRAGRLEITKELRQGRKEDRNG
jgi:hypothetical protein